MRSLFALAPTLCLCACVTEEEPLRFRMELPLQTTDRSMLVNIDDGQDRFEVHAFPISDTGTLDTLTIPLKRAESLTLTALFYRDSLEVMDLQAGQLTPDLTGDPNAGRPLPADPRIEQFSFENERVSAWIPQTELPQKLENFRLPRLDPCGTFTSTTITLGIAGSPQLAMTLDDRWVFIGTHSKTAFLVDRDGNVVPQELPSSFLAGYVETTGKIWLGGENGVVYEASLDPSVPELTLNISSTTLSGMPIWALSGPESGVPNERFALGWSPNVKGNWGALEHFDGNDWAYPFGNKRDPHTVAYVSEGLGLYATHFRDGELIGMRNRREVCTYVSSISLLGNILELRNIPGLGLIAGTSAGQLHRLNGDPVVGDCGGDPTFGGDWELLTSPSISAITATHPYENGLVFLAGNTMGRHVLGEAQCSLYIINQIGVQLGSSMAVIERDVMVPLVEGDPEDLNRAGLTDLKERALAWFKREQ